MIEERKGGSGVGGKMGVRYKVYFDEMSEQLARVVPFRSNKFTYNYLNLENILCNTTGLSLYSAK